MCVCWCALLGPISISSLPARPPAHALAHLLPAPSPMQGDCTVQIFVAPDTDSLCACTMLTVSPPPIETQNPKANRGISLRRSRRNAARLRVRRLVVPLGF